MIENWPLAVGIVSFCAWATHLVVCLQAGAWGLLVAGTVFFPVGILHGLARWFGLI